MAVWNQNIIIGISLVVIIALWYAGKRLIEYLVTGPARWAVVSAYYFVVITGSFYYFFSIMSDTSFSTNLEAVENRVGDALLSAPATMEAYANAVRKKAGSKAVASAADIPAVEGGSFMEILNRGAIAQRQALMPDPGYRENYMAMSGAGMSEGQAHELSVSAAHLEGNRNLVPALRAETLTDSAMVGELAHGVTGDWASAQQGSVLTRSAGVVDIPGAKRSNDKERALIGVDNGSAIRLEATSAGAMAPQKDATSAGTAEDEMQSFFAGASDMAVDEVAGAAALDAAVSSAGR